MDLDLSTAFPRLAALAADMTRTSVFVEIGALAACLLAAWFLAWQLRRMFAIDGKVLFGKRIVDGVLFPVLALVCALIARETLRGVTHLALIKVVIPILMSLAAIRLTARVMRAALPDSRVAIAVERTVSWFAWFAVVLWLLGILQPLLEELDEITWRMGGSQVSLGEVLHGVLMGGLVVMLMLWLSSVIERQLTRGSTASLSTRKIVANLIRIALLFIGLLVTLSVVGIDLTALSVFGGAIGVGVGFGLQKIAANYVSGFVILSERALRIGDMVMVDGFEGRITDIRTRYTVIRALNGRESLVPNELLITQRVENLTLADRRVVISAPLQVAYGTDVNALIPALVEVIATVPRVLRDPVPSVTLAGFGADGLDLTISYWIGDPENGQGAVRSAVNLAILARLDALGVDIPFPQRVLRQAEPWRTVVTRGGGGATTIGDAARGSS
ncbi:MAG TPA: mechanosensitive ion channel [Burkholderiaceae bacterium]|nr:mechanosensitive ion channel [Burkholderiaceae bacterium]